MGRLSRVISAGGLLSLYLLLSAIPLEATGPSYLEIEIAPLAVDPSGVVLFKTRRTANASGGHTILAESAEYGWLCASSTGVWEEHIHTRVIARPGAVGSEERHRRQHQEARANFEAPIDLREPPGSLSELMEECGTGDWKVVPPTSATPRAVWTPTVLCVDGWCSDRAIEQNSLGGLVSEKKTGAAVESRFYFEGLALFENIEHYDLPNEGAVFPVKNPACTQCVFDSQRISGISFVRVAAPK